jgi:hypothetical protein
VRLKSGFIHVPVPFIMATQTTAIDRITGSTEMKPWVLGTTYDRPIPRRIAEQAGVDRKSFGQYKKAVFRKSVLPIDPALRKQYLGFLRSRGIRHVWVFRKVNRLYYFILRLWAYVREFARTGSLRLDPWFGADRRSSQLTNRRLFHRQIHFPSLLHQWAVEVLVQQSTKMLLDANVDGRWTGARPTQATVPAERR